MKHTILPLQPRRAVLPVAALALALCAFAPRAGAQCAAQNFTLKRWWNAIYLEVSPEGTPNEVFGAWPVDSVGIYDPASFLATRQFSAEGESQGLAVSPIATWRRDYPELSSMTRIPAGVVCIAFNTGAVHRATVVGVPAAPRTTWHATTDGDTVYNFFGFSIQDGATTTIGQYMSGFEGLSGVGDECWQIGGYDRNAAPTTTGIATRDATVADGAVYLMPSSAVSDWSGALHVSPMDGLNFGTNTTLRTLSIRNDGGAPRTVSLSLSRAVAEMDPRLAFNPTFLHWRDAATALTNATWNAITGFGEIASKHLAKGETWEVQVGLDRAALPAGLVQGISFGALLTALDIDSGSKMKATVPLRAETSGASGEATAWPAGLWVADVALDTVDFDDASNPAPAGGALKLRLPIHVDAHGTIRLLQRVVSAGDTDANGHFAYHLYAGEASPPSTADQTLRISSAVLPTETPVIEASSSNLSAKFAFATFLFDVAPDGATSLLRHPFHPQHDGLRWDFSTPAPSGDTPENYKGEVKPETFTIKNSIFLMLDLSTGAARWDPQNTVSGQCTWTFGGLRHEGKLTASGPMTLRRISPLADIVLE